MSTLDQALANLGAAIAANPPKSTPEPEPPKTAQLLLFPTAADVRRACFRSAFRAALFPALNNRAPRKMLRKEKLASVDGVRVVFTGEQLSQTDLDAVLEVYKLMEEQELVEGLAFPAYALLKRLGWGTRGEDYERLHECLWRLCAATIEFHDQRYDFAGHILEGVLRDNLTKEYRLRVDQDFMRFFRLSRASLDVEQRRALKRDETAKALHAYFSSHAAPSWHKFETLADIIGLTNKNTRRLKFDILKSMGKLVAVGFLKEPPEVKGDSVKVKPHHTKSQSHFLAKKARKTTRKKPEAE